MKKLLLFIFLSCFAWSMAAQKEFHLSHGPYLQEVTGDGATVVFLTSGNSFSCVQLKSHGADDNQALSC